QTATYVRVNPRCAHAEIDADPEPAPIRTLVDAERAHITSTLRETNWVVGGPRGAATQLGVPRTTLIARMQRLGISNETSGQRATRANRDFVKAAGTHMQAAAAGAW